MKPRLPQIVVPTMPDLSTGPQPGAIVPVEQDALFTAALLAEADRLVEEWKRDPEKLHKWVLDRMMRNLVLQDHLVTKTIPGRSGPIIQAKAFDRFGDMAEAVLAAGASPEPKRRGKKKPTEEEE